MEILLHNRTDDVIEVVLEPIGDIIRIEPGQHAIVKYDVKCGNPRIDLHHNNHINVWIEGDVIVELGGKSMRFDDFTKSKF
jgi:hypothetical protein